MTSAPNTESIASRLIGRFARWLSARRDGSELRRLGPTDVMAIAKNLRIPRAELETLVAHGRQGADELPRMLAQLGIDKTAIARKEPGVLQDMTLVCALCVAKSRCNRELEAGTAPFDYREYCANAYTISAIERAERAGNDALLRGPACC